MHGSVKHLTNRVNVISEKALCLLREDHKNSNFIEFPLEFWFGIIGYHNCEVGYKWGYENTSVACIRL